MSPDEYRIERERRGTQASVAAQLGVHAQTIAKRERGAADAPITREAALALLSLPKKTRKRRRPQNKRLCPARIKPPARRLRSCA